VLANQLLPTHQSGFWAGYSIESAIIKMLSDLLNVVDSGDATILVLCDQLTAIDTVLWNVCTFQSGSVTQPSIGFALIFLAGVNMFVVAAPTPT
jgi:hypothetical protein